MADPTDHELLLKLLMRIDALMLAVETIDRDFRSMRERIYGNGKPGLLADIAELRRVLVDTTHGIESRDKLALIVVGAFVTVAGSLAVWFITNQIRVP